MLHINLDHVLKQFKSDNWSILKFFPVGRGEYLKSICLTYDEYLDIGKYLNEITNNKIRINFQYLMPNSKKIKMCRAVKKSIGILPDGTVISCFWALGKNMKPLKDKYILGNILHDDLDKILKNKKSLYWLNNSDNCDLCHEI